MILDSLVAYNSKVNWIVFCAIFCFTIGAWLDINGLWCELPIMVAELPEKWRLPSILSATTQIAQIGPLIFLAGKSIFPNQFTFVRAIYVILGIGALSCLLLAFFWNKTVFLWNQERSIGLYILNFSLAILDGTSSVTFLPYIGGNFIKEYIIPNYVGESLAALVPSILSLAQGLGQNNGCHNVTIFNETSKLNETVLEPKPIVPNFSVKVYFILMFLLLLLSTSAFTFLNFSKIAIKSRKKIEPCESKTKVSPIQSDDDSIIMGYQQSQESFINSSISVSISTSEENSNLLRSPLEKNEKIILLTYVFFLSFICYGVLPGLQSYSTLPYGNNIFNYAVNLSFVCLPFAIFLSIWSYDVSVLRISIEFSIACIFSLYILILSLLSPCPPLMNNFFGPFMTIISWIFSQSMFMRIRCLIATRLERYGQKTLLILGCLTMVGQIFGGLIIYIIVNTFEALKSTPDCVDRLEYCLKRT